jgi:hypothetical protein
MKTKTKTRQTRVALLLKSGYLIEVRSNRKFRLTVVDLDGLDAEPHEKRAEWAKLARILSRNT